MIITKDFLFQAIRNFSTTTVIVADQLSDSHTRELAIRTRFIESVTGNRTECFFIVNWNKNGECLDCQPFKADEFAEAIDYFLSICPPLTEQHKKDYVASQGQRCPFCKSDNITADNGFVAISESETHLNVKCRDCNRTWTDEYRLMDIH